MFAINQPSSDVVVLSSTIDIQRHPALDLIDDDDMQTTRITRSSVLGKRSHQPRDLSPAPRSCEQLQTPDPTPNPKRARTSTLVTDSDGNKENVPPFKGELVNGDSSPMSARAARALRRTATELLITPTRARPGQYISRLQCVTSF